MRENSLRRKLGVLLIGLAVLSETGCGTVGSGIVMAEKEPYERIVHATAKVIRGDLEPSVTVFLQPEGYSRLEYGATNEELQLDKVWVSVGDKVKKGDILVSFQSENIEKEIADYTEQKEQNRLLMEHYQRLMELDKDADYSADITMLQEDIRVAELYVEEAEDKLAEYQIVASEAGTITKVNEYLQNGYYKPNKKLITQTCGTGNYTAVTTETEVFLEGEIYTAKTGGAEYELRLKSIEEDRLTFEPVSDMIDSSKVETYTVTVGRERIEDAVYMEASALHTVAGDGEEPDTYFVYVVDEDGFLAPVWVTPGEYVDDYVIILSGLSGGEKVALD